MGDVKIKANRAAMRRIMKSPAAQAAVYAQANKIFLDVTNKCKPDNMSRLPYGIYSRLGTVSAHTYVFVQTKHGARAEARHHYLANSIPHSE